jgi:hypothetical protein
MVALEYDWDWFNAEKEFRLAVEINPNYAASAFHGKGGGRLLASLRGGGHGRIAETNQKWQEAAPRFCRYFW